MSELFNITNVIQNNYGVILYTIWVAIVGAIVTNYFLSRRENFKIKIEKENLAKGIFTELKIIKNNLKNIQKNNKHIENLILNDFVCSDNLLYFTSRKDILHFNQELIEDLEKIYQNIIRIKEIQKSLKKNISSLDLPQLDQLLIDTTKQITKISPILKNQYENHSIYTKIKSFFFDKKIKFPEEDD
jgi:hypothetical protein